MSAKWKHCSRKSGFASREIKVYICVASHVHGFMNYGEHFSNVLNPEIAGNRYSIGFATERERSWHESCCLNFEMLTGELVGCAA